MYIKKNIFFVTSTGTNLGKTFISKNIIRIFNKKKKIIYPLKPIITGVNSKNLFESDSALLLKEINPNISKKDINNISPWTFKNPLAPTLAAKKERKKIRYVDIKYWLDKELKKIDKDFALIEGAGGLMVPLDCKKSFIDLVTEYKIPIVLVVGNYLGTVSHTLSIVKNIETANLDLINIIINEGIKKSNLNIRDTKSLIKDNINKNYIIREVHKTKEKNKENFIKIYKDIISHFYK